MRQLIIARKDLKMGSGKLAAQVAHAAMAFLTFPMRKTKAVRDCGDHYEICYDCWGFAPKLH